MCGTEPLPDSRAKYVWQRGVAAAKRADVILPGASTPPTLVVPARPHPTHGSKKCVPGCSC